MTAKIPILQNQIRQLYLWVHPGNNNPGVGIYDSWKELIELLEFEPTLALLETTNHESQTPEQHHPDDLRLPWNSRAPYGFNVISPTPEVNDRKTVENEGQTCCEKVAELESLAKKLLGDRYQVWPHGNFVEAYKAPHLQALQDLFKVEARQLHPKQRGPNLFLQIHCFGLKPGACVFWQARNYGLGRIAYQVEEWGYCPLNTLSKAFLPNGLGERIPATQESLELMLSRGLIDYHRKTIRKLRESLPRYEEWTPVNDGWRTVDL